MVEELTGGASLKLLWIFSFVLFSYMVRDRIKPFLKREWDQEYQFSIRFQRPVQPILAKMYSRIQESNSEKLAIWVREEILNNTAVLQDRNMSYFLRARQDINKLESIYKDLELVDFIYDPKRWIKLHGGFQHSFFGFRRSKNITERFLSHLNRIVEKFNLEMMTLTRNYS